MTGAPREPIRTCVGCGQSAGQPSLVRLKAAGGHVVLDLARSGGRGAWLHPAEPCLDRALKRRILARALRADGAVVDARALRTELTVSARKD